MLLKECHDRMVLESLQKWNVCVSQALSDEFNREETRFCFFSDIRYQLKDHSANLLIYLFIVLLNKNLEFLGVGVFDLSPIFIYLINVLQDELKLL